MTKREKRRQEFLHNINRAMIIMEYYHHFSNREANASLVSEQASREEAEAAARLAQLLVKDREVKPEEFMTDPDILANKVVELTEKLESMKPKLKEYNLDESTLVQFSRDMEDKDAIYGMVMYAQPVLYYLKHFLNFAENKSLTKKHLQTIYQYYTSNSPFVPKELNATSRRFVREVLGYYEKLSKFNQI